jgi:hypothetical protein
LNGPPNYLERWIVPLIWWPAALGLGVLVAAEVAGVTPGSRAVPFLVVLPVTAALLALGSRGSIRVDAGVLHVPGARIPIARLDHGVVLDREAFRQQTGPMADPRAFVVSRPWLHTAVRLMLDDPDDPTPYWVVGTRRPQELLKALRGG